MGVQVNGLADFPYDAVILAGGRSSRMGEGRNKVTLEVEGRPLVATAVFAVEGAEQIVLVGPEAPLREALPGEWPSRLSATQEHPPFGGPVAGIAAGLERLGPKSAPVVALLACDVPGAPAALAAIMKTQLARSLWSSGNIDGVCALDEEGYPQRLLGLYRQEFLSRRAKEVSERNLSVRKFLATAKLEGLRVAERHVMDLDSPEDVSRYLTVQKRKERKTHGAND